MSEIINAIVPIEAIAPHPRNYKVHPPLQIAKLRSSHKRFTQYRSVVIWQRPDNTYVQVAGHGILEAMKERGVTHVRADILPEDTPEEDIEGILIADNNLPLGAVDNEELLAMLLQEQQDAGYDLASLGSDDEALRQMLESLGDSYLGSEQEDGAGGDEFDTTLDEEQTRVRLGDIWSLGRHRVICGDSTNPDTLKALMGNEKVTALITDPPYGINIVKNGTAGNFPGTNAPRLKAIPIAGDDKPFDPEHLLLLAPKIILWGGNHYAAKLPSEPKWLIWDKKDGAFQGSDLGDCELAWTNLGGAARLLHHTWQGMYRKGVGERDARKHLTQKPVDLMIWCCEQAELGQGEIVLDCYLGSGSTLIACERQGLRCCGSEIEPHYVNVVIQRWERETGQTAQLLERVEVPSHA